MAPWKAAIHSRTVLFGRGSWEALARRPDVLNVANIEMMSCELGDGFTVDGELIPLYRRKRVTISGGPPVRFWIG